MAQRVLSDNKVIRAFIPREEVHIDEHLPEWARRSNPIVRRHLGAFWKTLPPDFGVIVRLFGLQVAFVAISYLIPPLFTVIMPVVTVSLVILPATLFLYVQLLATIGVAGALSMVDEQRNDSLDLLLIIPRPLTHILYSKLAAALWRQAENFGLIVFAVTLCSLPLLIIQYDTIFSMEDNPLLMRVGLIMAVGSAVLRILLEPIMVGALGILFGAALPARVPAVVATGLIAGSYFAAINMLRLLPVDPLVRLGIETILPLVLPVIITVGAFRLAALVLRRD
ncbi:MAG: hypothetical protein IAE80_14740 [Anaerolinea sp.]|nr:hypothetical protein [Anaerolinea sp.]